ncbi:MAG: hypothetical protein QW520_07415 [Methanomassiliicoccales archaeon]
MVAKSEGFFAVTDHFTVTLPVLLYELAVGAKMVISGSGPGDPSSGTPTLESAVTATLLKSNVITIISAKADVIS